VLELGDASLEQRVGLGDELDGAQLEKRFSRLLEQYVGVGPAHCQKATAGNSSAPVDELSSSALS
jgi:hypothetical protein